MSRVFAWESHVSAPRPAVNDSSLRRTLNEKHFRLPCPSPLLQSRLPQRDGMGTGWRSHTSVTSSLLTFSRAHEYRNTPQWNRFRRSSAIAPESASNSTTCARRKKVDFGAGDRTNIVGTYFAPCSEEANHVSVQCNVGRLTKTLINRQALS